jgi:hypothetical protein
MSRTPDPPPASSCHALPRYHILAAIQVGDHLVGSPTARPVVIPAVQRGVGQKVKMAFTGHLLPRSLSALAGVRAPAYRNTPHPPDGFDGPILADRPPFANRPGSRWFLPTAKGNRLVNSWGVVNQRFGEFWTEILGFDGNHRGSFRDVVCLSRNGDFRPG